MHLPYLVKLFYDHDEATLATGKAAFNVRKRIRHCAISNEFGGGGGGGTNTLSCWVTPTPYPILRLPWVLPLVIPIVPLAFPVTVAVRVRRMPIHCSVPAPLLLYRHWLSGLRMESR